MKQVGKIISIEDGGYALLLVAKTSMCGENCGACKGGCKPGTQKVLARFDGAMDAKEGDMAVLEMEDGKVLLSAAMLYLLPLAAMFAAYFIADAMAKSEPISIISALVASFFVFFSAKLLDKKLKNSKKYEIRITKVLH